MKCPGLPRKVMFANPATSWEYGGAGRSISQNFFLQGIELNFHIRTEMSGVSPRLPMGAFFARN